MKIAYVYDLVYPYTKGGAEKRFWELAKRLAAKGHEAHIYGMKFWDGPADFVSEGVHLHGICREMPRYSSRGIRSIWQVLHFARHILPALRKERFDIIDCNGFPYLPVFPVKLFSLRKKIPLVVTWQEVWGAYWHQYLGWGRGFIGRGVEKAAIACAPHIIAYTQGVRNNLVEAGAVQSHISIIPEGVDLALVNGCFPCVENYDLAFVGRLIREKNVDLLIRAVALAREKFPKLKCLIIGDGPEREKLGQLAADLNLTRAIFFKGNLEYNEVISALKASRVFIFPSCREGFGIAPLEAMACGLPVITVRHPLNASAELVEESGAGYVCEPDARAIAAKAINLLSDENLRQTLGERGRLFAAAFDWGNVAVKNEELYYALVTAR